MSSVAPTGDEIESDLGGRGVDRDRTEKRLCAYTDLLCVVKSLG